VKANCWALAEEAGHEDPPRMQALPKTCRWDEDLRGERPGPAAGWLPCDPGDLIGPGIAIRETAQFKRDAATCVVPQHAGCLLVSIWNSRQSHPRHLQSHRSEPRIEERSGMVS
jgi:hypothetical protein